MKAYGRLVLGITDEAIEAPVRITGEIGYDAAANIAKEAAETGQSIREVAKVRTSLSDEELDKLLDPEAMTVPGLGSGGGGG